METCRVVAVSQLADMRFQRELDYYRGELMCDKYVRVKRMCTII